MVFLTPICEDDLDFVFDLYSKREVSKYLSKIPCPFTKANAFDLILDLVEKNRITCNRNMISRLDHTGERCGIIVLNETCDDRGVLGFSTHPDYQGRGVASRSIQLLLSSTAIASYRVIQASSQQDNAAAHTVLAKTGFRVNASGIPEKSVDGRTRLVDRWTFYP
ncbi:MAG: GNAT family N-acetyltransferase [Verrucomicrobiota bacterium]